LFQPKNLLHGERKIENPSCQSRVSASVYHHLIKVIAELTIRTVTNSAIIPQFGSSIATVDYPNYPIAVSSGRFEQYYPSPAPSHSTTSLRSGSTQSSQHSGSFELSEEDRQKGMCPIPECGHIFKDLKAHMLSH
jgi:hypothetical protein